MKKILPILALAATAAASQAADADKVYIVPFGSDGTPADTLAMTPQPDGSFTATAVTLDFGFQFYAVSEGGATLYRLAPWAASPAVQVLPNPLAITASQTPIPLEAGVYDVSFFTRTQTGQTYKLFTVAPVDAPRVYPSNIYLIFSNSTQEIGGDGTGIYQSVLTSSEPFRISYEPRAGVYVFGPSSGSSVELEDGIRQPIEYGTGTSATVSYTDTRRTAPEITVSLQQGDSYVVIGEDAGQSADYSPALPDDRQASSTWYSLSGMPVATADSGTVPSVAPGIYIVRTGDSIVKRYVNP